MSFCRGGVSKILQRLWVLRIFLLVCALAPFPVCAQEPGPREVVAQIVLRLKESKSPLVILDYVHWPSAYASFPEREKIAINVQSAEDLKRYYDKVFTDPSALIREQIAPKIKALPEDKRPELDAKLAAMEGVIKARFAEMTDMLARTEYQLGAAKEEGDTAVVELTTVLDGNSSSHDVRLIKIDNRWRLPVPQFVRLPGTPAAIPGAAMPGSGGPGARPSAVENPGVTRIQPQVQSTK